MFSISAEPTTSEMSGRSAPSAGHRWKRWRILESEATIVVLDERALTSESVPVLTIERRTGRAVESLRSPLDVHEWYGSGDVFLGKGCRDALHAYAILGVLCAEGITGLLVVTGAEVACEIDGKVIFEVTAVERLPLVAPLGAVDSAGWCENLRKLLCGRGFYFSQDFDITRTLQWKKKQAIETRRCGGVPVPQLPDGSLDLLGAADERFVWNRSLAEQLTRQEGVTSRWLVPLIQGHVQVAVQQAPVPGRSGWEVQLLLMLISRRGSGRAGTRYNARGLDDNGDTGNLIETEQLARFRLVEVAEDAGDCPHGCPQGWLSLVQLRGTVPLFWDQSPQGPVQLTRDLALSANAFERHQQKMEEAYDGEVFYINLLSSTPAEQPLTEALERQLEAFVADYQDRARIGYCHFDFHALVKGASQSEFDAELEVLIKELDLFFRRSGFLDATADSPAGPRSEPRRWQTGVLRTNCLDCLDRTNVVQFYITWTWLRCYCLKYPVLHAMLDDSSSQQDKGTSVPTWPVAGSSLLEGAAALQKAGASLLGPLFGGYAATSGGRGSEPEDKSGYGKLPLLRHLLQDLWADHGDRVSQLYTGANSNMSSVLRNGRMTTYAMIERSWQGINRAYQASFQDSQRQEAIDLLLGLHRASTDLPWLRSQLSRPSINPEVKRTRIGSLNLWAGTWNLNGKQEAWTEESAADVFDKWLGAEKADIWVFCLQELVELSASSIILLSQGDAARATSFEAAAQAALNRRADTVRVRSVGMVGLHLVVFLRAPLVPLLRDIRSTRVKSGIYGSAGNKGTVSVRFGILSTSFCVLCAHLESGVKRNDQRTAQLVDALYCFGSGSPPVPTAYMHDVVILAGDLNTRLDLPTHESEADLRAALRGAWAPGLRAPGPVSIDSAASAMDALPAPPRCSSNSWRSYLRYDQLLTSQLQVLHSLGLREGTIDFPPTYRLLHGSNAYDPARLPAWCDRVLYKAGEARLRAYGAVGSGMGSDHRPVFAHLEVNLLGNAADHTALDAAQRMPSCSGQGAGEPPVQPF